MAKLFRNRDADEFMDATSSKNLVQPAISGHFILWTVVLFFITFVIWAGLTNIDEVTKGMGKVIPSSRVQVLQHLEGGILSQILVQEGDVVKKGQKLLVIDDSSYASQYREGLIKAASLTAKITRLQAEIKQEPLHFSKYLLKKYPGICAAELELYESNKQAYEAKKSGLEEIVEQREKQYDSLKVRVDKQKKSYLLVYRELEMTVNLYKDGAASKVEVLRLRRQATDMYGEIEETEVNILRAKNEWDEAKNKLDELKLSIRSDAAKEMSAAKSMLIQQIETNSALSERAGRTVITSPVNGIIKVINIYTIGGTIKPGVDIMEIVPINDQLLIQAQVNPKDVAAIKPEQKATVKIMAYDFSIYGGLPGHVEFISPDTQQDQKGNVFYIIHVKTDRNYILKEKKKLYITPGMTAEVDILTGRKSILDYILKPILKARQTALRER